MFFNLPEVWNQVCQTNHITKGNKSPIRSLPNICLRNDTIYSELLVTAILESIAVCLQVIL
jgi:hypothetical protein